MAGMGDGYRIYSDLAQWWPVISPPEEYGAEASLLAEVFETAAIPVREVLDLGSGGGGIAVHLKDRMALTLVDLSEPMLAVSRQLNPECAHVRGDMRTVRLDRQFDGVLVHDAVDYMTSPDELRQVIETAFAHCRPEGVAVFVPDHTAETFRPSDGRGGGSDCSGRQASFREHDWDPDPADDWIQADYEFVLRDPDGTVHMVRETHHLGAFGKNTWLSLLAEAGFDLDQSDGPVSDSRIRGSLFIGRRPATRRPSAADS
jgi:SAM-dependent methyltransferase